MIELIVYGLIYLVGVISCYGAILRWCKKRHYDLEAEDTLRVYFMSLYSWIGLLVFLAVAYIKSIIYGE